MARFVPNPRLDDELRRNKQFLLGISEDVQNARDAAKGFAPVRSGDYRDSIEVEIQGKDVVLVAKDFKAHWIEWGSIHNSPSAPLRRGVQAAGLRFKEASK